MSDDIQNTANTLQALVRDAEKHDDTIFTVAETRRATVYTRQDVVLLVSYLLSATKLLRWILLVLIAILAIMIKSQL